MDVDVIDDGAEGSTLLKRLRGGIPMGMSFGFRNLKSRSATTQDPIDFSKVGAKPVKIQVYLQNEYWESSVVVFPSNAEPGIDTIRTGTTDRDRQIRDAVIQAMLLQIREVLAS